MNTLSERIQRRADSRKAVTFVGSGPQERVEWAKLHEDALVMAAGLRDLGIVPGDHIGIIGSTSRTLVTSIQAAWLAGATLVLLPLPTRLGSLEEFVRQTRGRISRADIRLLLVDPAMADFLEPTPGDPAIESLSNLSAQSRASSFEPPNFDPSTLAILQFTSGSTAEPKGVMLPHSTVLANLDAITSAAMIDRETDVLMSWLPLYHDMGLMMLIAAMTTGADLVLAAPQDFMAAPARWVQWMAEYRATATAGPNFSYALATRAMQRLERLDLSWWRIALNAAEPIDVRTLDAFCRAGARHDFDPSAVFCAYGMAESTVAVTFPEPGRGLIVDEVDRMMLEEEGYAAPVAPDSARACRMARLGHPLSGLEIRIVDPTAGVAVGERKVGEIEIRGSSVTPGYYRNPEATAQTFHEGWLRTGDLGYLVEGELVVCGRTKDMIIVGGRNIFPEDIERAVASVDGVRAGNVIAFGIPGRNGREAVVVVAETKLDDAASLRGDVASRIRDAIGLAPEEIVFVPPGTLPKTSSGKLQRCTCRTMFVGGRLAVA